MQQFRLKAKACATRCLRTAVGRLGGRCAAAGRGAISCHCVDDGTVGDRKESQDQKELDPKKRLEQVKLQTANLGPRVSSSHPWYMRSHLASLTDRYSRFVSCRGLRESHGNDTTTTGASDVALTSSSHSPRSRLLTLLWRGRTKHGKISSQPGTGAIALTASGTGTRTCTC